ncbi:hypothetical protein PS834_01063 [Pseudomonas fluorescens]|nr:hypothetical protein PS834_01063 [Pseudomonas fluorescens]
MDSEVFQFILAFPLDRICIERIQNDFPTLACLVQHKNFTIQVDDLFATLNYRCPFMMVSSDYSSVAIYVDSIIGKYRGEFSDLEKSIVTGNFLLSSGICALLIPLSNTVVSKKTNYFLCITFVECGFVLMNYVIDLLLLSLYCGIARKRKGFIGRYRRRYSYG